MADTTTPNYGYTLPEVGASKDTWGTKLNANWTKADAQFKTLTDAIASGIDTALKTKIFPVGSIFASTSSANPATALGFGTWEAFAPGRVMVGVGTADGVAWAANELKGNNTVTLTEAQIPSHTHTVNPASATVTSGTNSVGHTHTVNPASATFTTSAESADHTHSINPPVTTTSSDSHTHTTAATTTGAAGSHAHTLFSTGASTGNLSGGTPVAYHWDTDRANDYTMQSASAAASIGASNTVASHTHSIPAQTTSSDTHTHTVDIAAFNSGGRSAGHTHTVAVDLGATTSSGESAPHTHQVTIDLPSATSSATGSGGSHINYQPGVGVYLWRRTA